MFQFGCICENEHTAICPSVFLHFTIKEWLLEHIQNNNDLWNCAGMAVIIVSMRQIMKKIFTFQKNVAFIMFYCFIQFFAKWALCSGRFCLIACPFACFNFSGLDHIFRIFSHVHFHP